MKKLLIGLDVDSVLADLGKKWCEEHNKEFGHLGQPMSMDTWVDWDMTKNCHPSVGKKVYHCLSQPGFFRNMELIPGALEGVTALHEMGHDLVIASAAKDAGATKDKIHWLEEHFPFIPRNNHFVTCYRKELLALDMLIDDGPHNLAASRKRWGSQIKLVTIDYLYNRYVQDQVDFTAHGYKDFANAWLDIVCYVRSQS